MDQMTHKLDKPDNWIDEVYDDRDRDQPRLITEWRGQTLLAGNAAEPQNWFITHQFELQPRREVRP